jgi:excisionase family DNA binding protein
MAETLPALLTVEEAARLLRVGRTKAYAMTQEWRATGGAAGLPVVDFGNVLRVPRQALEDLIGAPLADAEMTATSNTTERATATGRHVEAPPAPHAPPISHHAATVVTPTSTRSATRRSRRAESSAQAALFDA